LGELARTVNQRQAAQVAALTDRMSRLEVKQTGRESDVTTVEGAGLAIAECWDRRSQATRRSSSLAPSTVVIPGQFVSLLVSSQPVGLRSYLCGLSGSLFWASSAK